MNSFPVHEVFDNQNQTSKTQENTSNTSSTSQSQSGTALTDGNDEVSEGDNSIPEIHCPGILPNPNVNGTPMQIPGPLDLGTTIQTAPVQTAPMQTQGPLVKNRGPQINEQT